MPVQVNVTADQQNLINSIERGVQAYNQRFSKSNAINLNINERGFSQPLGRITGAVNDFESAMAASNARVIAFGASTAVLGSAIAGFKSLAKASIEVEKNLADVNRILQLNTDTLQQFGKELFNISKRTATSFNDASKALLEFSRQGLSAEETLRRTNDALTLTRLAGLGAEASVAALTATVNGFAKSGITTTQVLNKLVAVEQAFAVSARDLSEGLSRTGQAAQEAGVNIDQLNALISAAQQRTARGGAVIGNALKTIFTRLQRSDTLDRLEEFNIAVRDVQGNTLPATTVLQNFAAAYNRLADAQRAQLSEQVAGVYQVNILKAIVSDLNSEQSIYNQALLKGANATNEASRANAQLNQTLSALLTQVGNNTQQLASTIGSVTFEPLAKSAAKAANSILESLTDVLTGDGIGSDLANGLLKGIRNVLGGPGAIAAFYTLFKLVQSSFTYVAQALPQIAGITTETQKRQNLEQAILSILQQESHVSKSILVNNGNQKRQAEILLGVARQQTAQYKEQLALANSLAGTLRTQGVSAGARGLQFGKTRSGGYIPASTRMAERAGAFAGGYAPGKVVNSPVGGVMNTAEDVKYVPGFAQPFINPPRNSRAGKLHRANAVKQVGIDPYLYGGFVPNFASGFDGRYGIKGLAGKEGKYNFEKYVTSKEFEKNSTQKTAPSVLAGRIFESRLQNLKFIDLFENISEPDVQVGPYRVREAKLSLQAGLRDPKVRSGKKVGDGLIVPSTANRSSESRLNELGIDVTYAKGQTHNKLFGKARQLIERYKYTPTYKIPRKIPINSSGSIPNFAAAYRNPFTGALNNAAIARGLKSGKLTAQQAEAMGYSTSGSKIDARKAQRAAAVNALNYTTAYVPWDIEGFRGGRSGGRLNIAQGTAYEKFILDLLRSGKLKGTTSLGAPFALPARPDVVSSAALKGGTSARIDAYSLSAGEMYEMKAGDPGATLAGLQNKFVKAIENNPEILDPKRKWKNYIFRTTKAKGRGASGGFIPNFAYKGQVMDLEEFISGQKAIYSESPFPHVRNESQPTFASAIADHGGLGNALRDSYRNQSAAGMVYGGYVPNFAPKGTITAQAAGIDNLSTAGSELQKTFYKLQGAMRKLTQSTDLSTEQRNILRQDLRTYARTIDSATGSTKALDSVNKALANSKKKNKTAVDRNITSVNKNTQSVNKNTQQNNKGSFLGRANKFLGQGNAALAIGGPMLAGLIEQSAFGGRQRSDMSSLERSGQSFLSTGLTSITTGASIGGLPGAVVGAGIALVSAFNAAELSAQELAEVNEKLAQENQESVSTASAYVNAQKKLNDLIQSGAANAEIEQASKAVRDSFYAIKDVNLQRSFTEAGSDVEKMTEKLSEFSTAFAKTQAVRNLGAIDVFEKSAGFAADLRGGPTPFEASTAFANLDKNAVKSLLFTSGLDLKRLQELAKEGGLRSGNLLGNLSMGGMDARGPFAAVRGKFEEDISNELTSILTDSGLSEQADDFKAAYKFFVNFLFGPDAFGIIRDLDKDNKTFDLTDKIRSFSAVSSRSFNKIFQAINDSFDRISNETLSVLEQARSDQQINKTILDFTTSFTDSISSFVSSNLPDLERYQFAQSAARQKANNQLAQLAQDSDNFEQNQINQKRQALEKNADEISASFEKNLFQSQAVGEIFRDRILPQLKKGNYDINIDEIQKQAQKDAVLEFNKKYFSDYPQAGIFGGLNDVGQLTDDNYGNLSREEVSKEIKKEIDKIEKELGYLNRVKGGDEPSYEGSVEAAQKRYDELIQKAKDLQELEKVISLTKEEKSTAEIQSLLKRKQDEQKLFEASAANAKKEFELNKALAEEKIRFDKLIAEERAKTDNEILENQRRISEQISKAQYDVGLQNINSQRDIAAIDRTLSDPRVFYGLDRTQRNEERFRLEDDRLKLQRDMEQRILDQEIAQSNLEIISRAHNTDALMLLNETVASQYKRELEAQGAGGVNAQRIADYRAVGASEAEISNIIGAEAYTREMSYAENNQRIANAQALRNMSRTEPGAALTQQEINSFLEKAKEMPGVVGDEARKLQRVNDLRRANVKATNENVDLQRELERSVAREQSTLGGAFRKGVGDMNQQSQDILLNLAETAPSRFADGMANALSEVAQGTKSLGDAFTDMAIDFGRMLQQEVFRALAAKAVGNLLGSFSTGQTGGLMSKGIIKAQNGMYISGGRTGDRNLALLEDGEYVLNRNAVRMMGGPKGLDNLNFNMAPRFASGGAYSLRPEQQRLKSGELDFTGNYISSNSAGRISDDMFTSYALAEDKYFQDRKQKARERLERKIQKNYERKMKRAQLVSSIVAAVGSMMMAYGASGMSASSAAGAQGKAAFQSGQMVGVDSATQAGLQQAASKSNYAFGQFMQKNASNIMVNNIPLNNLASSVSGTLSETVSGLRNIGANDAYINNFLSKASAGPVGKGISGMNSISSGLSSQGIAAAQKASKAGLFSRLFSSGANVASSVGKRQIGGIVGYNSGGFVPHGSRLSDTIPAMLTGGEYIMNNKAVKKYGLGTMNAMNSGAYQSGGMASSTTNNNSTSNNNTNISVKIDRAGNSVFGADSNSYEQNDVIMSKKMAKQINSIVLRTISNEKRYGGELSKNDLG